MNRVFLSRLFSTLVLWAIVLGGVLSGNELAFFALIGVLGLVALREFYRMLDARGKTHFGNLGLLCGFGLLLATFMAARSGKPTPFTVLDAVFIAFLILSVRQMIACKGKTPEFQSLCYTFFGLCYIVVFFNYMTKIVYLPPRAEDLQVTGQFYILYLMVVTKFSDMGAYLVGSRIGKHPMAPSISPKKTWEGFVGALLFSTLGSFAMLALLSERLPLLQGWEHALFLGLLLGLAAIGGDLLESVIKRATDVKDSGHFLPGIGGALDLIDSLLFTAPLLYLYLRWLTAC